MASVNRISLLDATALTAASTNGTAKVLESLTTDFIGWLVVSACNAATTVTVKIQHSADNSNWVDVDTFADVVGAAGFKNLNITAHLHQYVRCNVVLSGVTKAATVAVSLHHDKKR